MNVKLAISKLSKIDEVEIVVSARFNKNYLGDKAKLKSITISDDSIIEVLGECGLKIYIPLYDLKEILDYSTSITFLTSNIQILFRWKLPIETNEGQGELSRI
ncbi:Uncharacterised protein [[Clostridium] sordellii]|uniref:hypothetical protein n=1 Tax=Paraclostridium sordellii TaxID=1505 RepID=UPI0005DCFBE8|nr:hypothetical protein [Paeniclostridium sordellii]MCH1964894.1 hypothetical protein [Paeniclostridium sordellii]CEO36548.1 Uncharacterised protein [[Clostridium] sordellii] [Paeniclostridium sordellii]